MAAPTKDSLEFLPREEWEKSAFGKILKWTLTAGRYIVILTELVVIIAFLSRFKFDRELTDLNEEIKQKKSIVEASAQFEKKFRFLQTQLQTIRTLQNQQLQTDRVLVELASLVPVDVLLANLKVTEKEVSLTATALSESGFATFLKNLKSSPRFENLVLSQVQSGVEKQIGITFTLKTTHGS